MEASISTRPFIPWSGEYEALAALSNAAYPGYPVTAERLRYEDEHFDRTQYVAECWVAEDEATHDILGWFEYHHMPSAFHRQRFRVRLGVHPDHRRRGVGRLLYDEMLEDLIRFDATELHTQIDEPSAEGIAFAARRGFVEVNRMWESRLDPRAFDPAPFRERLDRVAAAYTLTTLAEEQATNEDWLPELFLLHTAIMRDMPAAVPYTPPTLQHFREFTVEQPGLYPGAWFIAKAGNRYIGETFLRLTPGWDRALRQGLTGVRREHRGKGVALALKVLALDWAKRHGYEAVTAGNAAENAGMIAINERLGFVRQGAVLHYVKRL